MSNDLSLVSTQVILDELQKRFEAMVFVGHSDHSVAEDRSTYRYAGSYLLTLGIVTRLLYKIHMEMDDVGREGTVDDD